MRFPHEAYARMVAQEKTSEPRQVAKKVAGEKKVVEESAIEDIDEQEVPDDGTEDENLVD